MVHQGGGVREGRRCPDRLRRNQLDHAGRAGRATLAGPVRALQAGDRLRASDLRMGVGCARQGACPCRHSRPRPARGRAGGEAAVRLSRPQRRPGGKPTWVAVPVSVRCGRVVEPASGGAGGRSAAPPGMFPDFERAELYDAGIERSGNLGADLDHHIDLSPRQKEWLASDPEQVEAYLSTFCDIFDFSASLYSFDGYSEPPDAAMHLLGLAALQLQGASATLCTALDERGAIRSSLVGVELALKAALAGNGANDADLKGYGHDLERLANAVTDVYESFELTSVKARMRVLPKLVENRYSSAQPSRTETGEIVMASQYIAGAVARALTGGSLRARLRGT